MPKEIRQLLEIGTLSLDGNYKHPNRAPLRDFMTTGSNMFWNLVWYFTDSGLPFDFMLPYKDTSIEEEFY